MLTAMQFVATLCAALFAGAAVYITLAEHPARMTFDTKVAAAVWAQSYKRAAVMQATLAMLSFLTGVVAAWLGGGLMWLVAAVVIGSVVPFTLIVVKPTNDQLLAPDRDLASAATRRLLEKWGRLHAVRSGLSLLAALLYLELLMTR